MYLCTSNYNLDNMFTHYSVFKSRMQFGSRLSFSLEGCKEDYYWLSIAVWNFLLELALNLDV